MWQDRKIRKAGCVIKPKIKKKKDWKIKLAGKNFSFIWARAFEGVDRLMLIDAESEICSSLSIPDRFFFVHFTGIPNWKKPESKLQRLYVKSQSKLDSFYLEATISLQEQKLPKEGWEHQVILSKTYNCCYGCTTFSVLIILISYKILDPI